MKKDTKEMTGAERLKKKQAEASAKLRQRTGLSEEQIILESAGMVDSSEIVSHGATPSNPFVKRDNNIVSVEEFDEQRDKTDKSIRTTPFIKNKRFRRKKAF